MTVDLTSVGTIDWVQWPGYVRKATGAGKISDLVPVGNGASNVYTNDGRTLSWRDGTPIVSGSSTGGISVSGADAGLKISAPADTTTRILTVYVGAQNANGKLTAHLSDGSAPDYVQTFSAGKGRQDGVFTLTYRAASAGQQITVSWTNSGKRGKAGNVSLQGATLN
jgi:hypothetical protein